MALACLGAQPAWSSQGPPKVVVFTDAGWPEAEQRLLAELNLLAVEVERRPRPGGRQAEAQRAAIARDSHAAAAVMLSRSSEAQVVVWAWIDTDGLGRASRRTLEDEGPGDAALAAVDIVKAGLVEIKRLPPETGPPPPTLPPENDSSLVRFRGRVDIGARLPTEAVATSAQFGVAAGVLIAERLVVELATVVAPGPGTFQTGAGQVDIGSAALLGFAAVEFLPDGPLRLELALGGGIMWVWASGGAGALSDVGDLASAGVFAARLTAALPVTEWLDVGLSVSALVAPSPIELDSGGAVVGRLGLPIIDLGLGLRATLPQ